MKKPLKIDYEIAKENLTNEEIVNLLSYIERGYIPDYNFTGTEDDLENYKLHIALQRAVEAVKNQVHNEYEKIIRL